MDSEGISFLRQVAVEDGISWINIHHRIALPDGGIAIPGNAHLRIRTAIEDAKYWANRGHCVYLGLGMYRNAGPDRRPYPKAIRQIQNLVACKSLYMDVDVKEGGYVSTNEALQALKGFHAATGLPMPTIIVGSGNGGMHVYWTLSTEFDPQEFKRMASQLVAAGIQHGLKFDQLCTNDSVHLMRIPGTWNFKGGPDVEAKPVTLMHNTQKDIDIEEMRAALSKFKGAPTLRVVGGSAKKPSPNDDLAGGMGSNFPLPKIDEVAKDCPFIQETLDTGGKGYGEPLWKLSLALAARCEEPEATAHRLSKGHDEYDPDATEAKLAQNHGSGPPYCTTIAMLAPQCKSCVHRDLGTGPLGVRYKKSHNHAAFTTTPNANAGSIDLPEKYWRGTDNLIYMTATNEEGEETAVLVCEYQIIPGSASLEAGKPFRFSFDTMQGEKVVNKRFDCTIISDDTTFARAFAAEGMAITIPVKLTRMLVTNYLKLLQDKKETLITVPAFGWSQDHNNELGFAYAGRFISPAGEFRASKPAEGAKDYRVAGDDSIWTGLMNIILTQDRPDIACMVASSFGAPLVGMSGENGLLLGLWSTQSGIGKTTALTAAQAVWSKPVVGGLSDTVNYTFAKCATLRHLPIYYDEIKGEKQTRAMVELVFQLTGGREKGRSGRTGEMREVREFETLCAYASNSSLVEAVREHHQGTDASWLRMFEMQAIIKPNNEPNFSNEVRERLTQLRLNFGGIGAKYAEFLGKNQVKLSKALLDYQIKLAKAINADPQVERFWIAAMSTTMLGAWCANHLKLCSFPLVEMRDYLIGEYKRMKQEMVENPSDLGSDKALLSAMGAFLGEKFPRNMIILDKTWTSRTKPPQGYAKILNDRLDTQWGALEVQVSGDPLTLRVVDTALGQWCARTKIPKNSLVEQLKKKLNARMSMVVIGSGTPKGGASQNSLIIEAKGTILEDMLEYAVHYKLLPP